MHTKMKTRKLDISNLYYLQGIRPDRVRPPAAAGSAAHTMVGVV